MHDAFDWSPILATLGVVCSVLMAYIAAVFTGLRMEIRHIEDMIGNGKPGVFPRREELNLAVEKVRVDSRHDARNMDQALIHTHEAHYHKVSS